MSPIGQPSTSPLAMTLARSSAGQARRSSVSSLKYWMNFMTDAIIRSPGSLGVAEELGVGGAEDALGEVHHQRLVLLGHAVDVHDHAQRVGLGDVLGEVALAAELAHALDEEVGELVDAGLAVRRPRRA